MNSDYANWVFLEVGEIRSSCSAAITAAGESFADVRLFPDPRRRTASAPSEDGHSALQQRLSQVGDVKRLLVHDVGNNGPKLIGH